MPGAPDHLEPRGLRAWKVRIAETGLDRNALHQLDRRLRGRALADVDRERKRENQGEGMGAHRVTLA